MGVPLCVCVCVCVHASVCVCVCVLYKPVLVIYRENKDCVLRSSYSVFRLFCAYGTPCSTRALRFY